MKRRKYFCHPDLNAHLKYIQVFVTLSPIHIQAHTSIYYIHSIVHVLCCLQKKKRGRGTHDIMFASTIKCLFKYKYYGKWERERESERVLLSIIKRKKALNNLTRLGKRFRWAVFISLMLECLRKAKKTKTNNKKCENNIMKP